MSICWKCVVVVSSGQQKYLSNCCTRLRGIGFDEGLHVVCDDRVSVPSDGDIARHRDDRILGESSIWSLALDTMAKTYSAENDLFLFTSPNLRFWSELRKFCEATVENDFVGIYLPYMPVRMYVERDRGNLPCRDGQIGWCEIGLNDALVGSSAMILHRHALRVVADYVRDAPNLASHSWADVVATVLGRRHRVAAFAATPSFAQEMGGNPTDFVAAKTTTQPLDLRKCFYLN